MRSKEWVHGLALVAAIALLVLPYIFPVCPVEGKPMRCFFTYRAEFLFAWLAILGALLLLQARQPEVKKIVGVFLVAIAAAVFILPFSWSAGICMHADSACHVTTGWIRGASILLAGSGLFTIW
jgi:hypothetical protein